MRRGDDEAVSDEELFLAVLRMRIKKRRIERRLRQEDVAEEANMVLRTYQRYEAYNSEQFFNPTLRNVMAVARALATTVPDLTRELTKEEVEELSKADMRRVWHDGKLV